MNSFRKIKKKQSYKSLKDLQKCCLIISNKEKSDIMKIVQALEEFNILLKGLTKRIKNKTKEQK